MEINPSIEFNSRNIDRIGQVDDLISRESDPSMEGLRKVLNEYGLRAAFNWLLRRGHLLLGLSD